MGVSTFMTQDTNEVIWNVFTNRPTEVKILLPWGVYKEGVTNDGYLRFDGESYFELLAKESGYTCTEEEREKNPYILHDIGTDLYINHQDSVEFPKVVSMGFDGVYTDIKGRPEFCNDGSQGHWGQDDV